MNKASIIGLFLGITAVVFGTLLEGGKLTFILQPAAAVIVFGGTFGATLLSFSFKDILQAFKSLKDVFFKTSNNVSFRTAIDQLINLAGISRKKGIISLEPYLKEINDPFFNKALSLAIDGMKPQLLRELLEEEISYLEDSRFAVARVFETAGGIAPTIGIIGAIIGLIHVMQNLAEPAKLGQGIAVAFVATLYGVGSANLIFLPIAKKIRHNLYNEIQARRLIVEGVLGIQSGLHPHYLRERLLSFIETKTL